ncbi:hypothetical protein DOY81_000810 [Sarcophaga bullata]|nr:hypothetical protein DOY81_000810 [Sarcophaga bullata]
MQTTQSENNNAYDLPPPPPGMQHQHHHHQRHHNAVPHLPDSIDDPHLGLEDKDPLRSEHHNLKDFNQHLYMTRKKLRRYRKKHLKAHDLTSNGGDSASSLPSGLYGKNSLNMENFMSLQPPLTPTVIRT